MNRPPVSVLVVAGLLATGVAVGQVLREAPVGPAAGAAVPVVGAGALCPDVRQVPGLAQTAVAAGVAPAAEGAPAATGDGSTPPPAGGAVTAQVVAGQDAPRSTVALPLTAPGQAVAGLAADVSDAGYAVRATGALAPGLTVQQTTTSTTGAERGLAALRCEAARTRTWLLGGGATVGETAELVLTNPEDVEAVVDLTVLTAEGPTDDRSGRGITVPARGRTVVALDTLASDRSRLAVGVVAARGRVAAALRHTRFDGVVPRGVEYAASAPAPTEQVVVPGLPAGPGDRQLWLANPGETDVVVEVQLTTGDGQFVPEGLAELPVPAGSTVAADLTAALGGTAAAARVTAIGGPVLAAGFADDAGDGDVRDLAYVAAAGPLDSPALLPEVSLDGTSRHVLLLSALTGDAVVDVEAVALAGAPPLGAAPRRVEVPGGRTVAVSVADLVPADLRGRIAVQVRPDTVGSAVHAGVVHRGRPADQPLLTAIPLVGSAPPVTRPAVVRDPAVGGR